MLKLRKKEKRESSPASFRKAAVSGCLPKSRRGRAKRASTYYDTEQFTSIQILNESNASFFDAEESAPIVQSPIVTGNGWVSISSEVLGNRESSLSHRNASNSPSNRGKIAPIESGFSIENLLDRIQNPKVRTEVQGYPGSLTNSQHQECRTFLTLLQKSTPELREQIFSFHAFEEPEYTICRWLRGGNFDAKAVMGRCKKQQAQFQKAQEDRFYPNISEALGVPLPIFLSQFPFVGIGYARNGCPVNYFPIGRINMDGILSITTIDRLEAYFWWAYTHKMKQEIVYQRDRDPNFVRCETINVIDLKGLSCSKVTTEVLQVLKIAAAVGHFFPETLSKTLILNTPRCFRIIWGVIRKLFNPRTVERVHTVGEQDSLRVLREHIETNQLPEDYGGHNTSLSEAHASFDSQPGLVRREVELVRIKPKIVDRRTKQWKINPGESVKVSVYTRSRSDAKFTVRLDGQQVATLYTPQEFKAELINRQTEPQSFTIFQDRAPGTSERHLAIELRSLRSNDGRGPNSDSYLLVAEVTKLTEL